MEKAIRNLRVKRALVFFGIVLLTIGLVVGVKAVSVAGAIAAAIGFISAGGA